MGKRAIQLVLIGLAGAFLAWWLMPDDQALPAPTPKAHRIAELPPTGPRAAPVPSTSNQVTFRLPRMPSPAPEAAAAPPPPPSSFLIPREWQLRGSASKNYELRSDRGVVFA